MTRDQLIEWKAQRLDELVCMTEDFEDDEEINGADFVEFFTRWRQFTKEFVEAHHESQ